jgi:uridine kinase
MDKQDKRGNKNDDEISLPPLLVGVAGGSASGKSTLCEKIIGELCRDNSSFTVISLDSYYKGVEKGQDASDYNFDHPDALDWEEA